MAIFIFLHHHTMLLLFVSVLVIRDFLFPRMSDSFFVVMCIWQNFEIDVFCSDQFFADLL